MTKYDEWLLENEPGEVAERRKREEMEREFWESMEREDDD